MYIKDALFKMDNVTFQSNTASGDFSDKANPKKGQGGGLYTEISDQALSNNTISSGNG